MISQISGNVDPVPFQTLYTQALVNQVFLFLLQLLFRNVILREQALVTRHGLLGQFDAAFLAIDLPTQLGQFQLQAGDFLLQRIPFFLLDRARLGQFVYERLTPLGDIGADRSLNVSLHAGLPVARQHEKHVTLFDFQSFHDMLLQQNACLERKHLP